MNNTVGNKILQFFFKLKGPKIAENSPKKSVFDKYRIKYKKFRTNILLTVETSGSSIQKEIIA